jgi:hypothetical protein
MSDSPLDRLTIPRPCPISWDSMTGDERVRLCSQCKTNVYNLSEMTRKEAEALIIEKEGNLCARIYKRADGTIITNDCRLAVKLIRQTLKRITAAASFCLALAWPAKAIAESTAEIDYDGKLYVQRDLIEKSETLEQLDSRQCRILRLLTIPVMRYSSWLLDPPTKIASISGGATASLLGPEPLGVEQSSIRQKLTAKTEDFRSADLLVLKYEFLRKKFLVVDEDAWAGLGEKFERGFNR